MARRGGGGSRAARSPSNARGSSLGATDRGDRLVERFAACFQRTGRTAEAVVDEVATLVGSGRRDRARLRGPARPRPAAPRPGARGGALAGWRRGNGRCAPLAGERRHAHRLEHGAAGSRPLPLDSPTTGAAIEALVAGPLLDATTRAPKEIVLISTRPTTRCTATRRGGSSRRPTYCQPRPAARRLLLARHLLAAKLDGAPTSTPRPARVEEAVAHRRAGSARPLAAASGHPAARRCAASRASP